MSTLTYESYRIEGDDADNEGDAEVDHDLAVMGLALTAVWYPSGPVKRRRADHVGSALSKLNTFTVADGGELPPTSPARGCRGRLYRRRPLR